jgi:transcriptional regulator with XRE-family HTH domain
MICLTNDIDISLIEMDKEQRERLAKLIKEIRGDRTMRAVARDMGVSAVAITSWEHGDSVPAYDSFEKIAEAKGWTIYQLLAYLRGEELEPSSEKIMEQAMNLPTRDKIRLASLLLSAKDVQSVQS